MRKSILIVEDEAIIALMLQRFLSSLNYQIIGIVNEGLKAIEMTKTLKPDLVIMDVVIQGDMNGVETFKKIRNFSDVPVIFLTGNSLETIQKEEKCNSSEVFSKPILMEELKQTLSKVFQQS